jgi:uncharacterized protein YdeI (YjbR/CyaY-like superfamily)
MAAKEDEPLDFAHQAEWAQWLSRHHADSGGVWVRHAKKGAPKTSVSHDEALEVALCFGWIDGKRKGLDQHYFLQRWVPRAAKSIWSKINRDRALRYIEEGRMQPAGLKEVERARADGRWDAAYDSFSTSKVPADLQAAFDVHPGAAEFFATVSAQNRYAVLFRIQTTKMPTTRAKKIEQYAQMLARGETLHPQRVPGKVSE